MASSGIFCDIKFIVDVADEDVLDTLLADGAMQYQSLASVPGASTVHLITNDFNSPISLAARLPPYNNRVIICTPAWVRASRTKAKLQDVRRYSPDPRQFFTGVCVTCSELPDGDKEAIYGGVLALGGQYSDTLVKGTTHIVTLSMNSAKVKAAVDRPRAGVEIVLPHWFDDCLRLRRRIPVEPYRFPHPRILQTNYSQGAPVPTSQNTDFRHLCNSSLTLAEAPETTEDIFGGKSVFLGSDLDLGGRLTTTLCAILGSANAVLAKSIDKADMYIGKYRDGQQYLAASRSNKIVGNYTWILYCLAHGKYSSPRDHLLHYPIARDGLYDFRNDIITVSNYTGEPRVYLECLITALGAKFTRNMKPENTHLITAAECGEKYNTAKQWGVLCVNHLWLEESYAKWQKQAETSSHYVTFPKETNLMDVIAQTPVLSEGLASFLPEDDTDDEVGLPTAEPRQKLAHHSGSHSVTAKPPHDDHARLVREPQDESQDVELPDITVVRDFSSPLPAVKQASAPGRKEKASENSASPAHSSSEDDLTPKPPEAPAYAAKNLAPRDVDRLGTPRNALVQTPSSRGSSARKASQAAATKLRENMEDANRFGQQMRNKHKLPALPSEAQSAKKPKLVSSRSSTPRRKITVVMTGCPELTEKLHDEAEALGVEFVDDPNLATHLLAPRVARTKKFVVAIPKCDYFVNWSWLLDSAKAQELLPEQSYPIETALPAAWSRNLVFSEVLARAKDARSKGGLLRGLVILVSDAVTKIGGFETYRDIVVANGGTCGLIGRRGVNTKVGRVVLIVDGKADPAVAKNGAINKSGHKGKENKDAKEGVKHEIYDREWLMMCAIRQTLTFEENLKLV